MNSTIEERRLRDFGKAAHWLLFIALLLGMNGRPHAAKEYQGPSAPKDGQSDQAQPNRAQKTGASSGGIQQQTQNPIEADAENSQSKHSKDAPSTELSAAWFKAQVVIGAIIAALTLAYVFANYRLLRVVKAQADVLINSERAWLHVELDLRVEEEEPPFEEYHAIEVTNYGRTPADIRFVCIARYKCNIKSKPFSLDGATFIDNKVSHINKLLSPGKSKTLHSFYVFTKFDRKELRQWFEEDKSGALKIIVNYRDMLGARGVEKTNLNLTQRFLARFFGRNARASHNTIIVCALDASMTLFEKPELAEYT